jgi:XTP/dITP diphosphohydrolase
VKLGRVVVASQNPDKIREMHEVLRQLDPEVEIVTGLSWPEVEETEPTLEGNALLKARHVHERTGYTALADDTGLEVAALDGRPGVMTARYSGPDASYESNVSKLLLEMRGAVDRRARFRTAVALVAADSAPVVVEGALEGTITQEPRGTGGFGYDPVFEVDGMTLAEMSPEDKHAVSHRARALRALALRLAT